MGIPLFLVGNFKIIQIVVFKYMNDENSIYLSISIIFITVVLFILYLPLFVKIAEICINKIENYGKRESIKTDSTHNA